MSKKKKVIKKNYMPHYITLFLVLLIGGYFMFGNSNDESAENKFSGYQQFDFRKDGELTFQNSEGKFISKIDVEIADDLVERAVGLMYREKLEFDQGMLFIFPTEEYQSFWMKNTVLPLDILFVNKKMEIVTIHRDTTPFAETSYPSTAPSIYVVEVNAGYTEQFGIKEGDKISWRLN
ncbi:MAG: DUF192 domain-containing protein [Ignavibacteriales bacterium]|jgi:uncharacterized membrane protein (UPF0127 family)|nr:MAG: DUF192 domain-containing protein [Ignavibacteriales bacterium]